MRAHHLQKCGRSNTCRVFENIVRILPFVFPIFFIYIQAKPRGVFKTERNTASPKSKAVREIPTLALTFTTDALESTGQQMGTDAPTE